MSNSKFLAVGLSLLLTLAVVFPAGAGPRIKGDWISSGAQADLMLPEPPAYDVSYNCQVELTNNYRRNSDGALLIAVANFTVDNEHFGGVLSKDLRWFWMYLDDDGVQHDLAHKPKNGFNTADHVFDFSIYDVAGTESGDDDRVSIMAQLGLRFGSYVYRKAAWSAEATRLDESVVVTNEVSAYSDAGKAKALQVYLQCDKVR